MSKRARPRLLLGLLSVALSVLAMAAPTAAGFQEFWQGTWSYVSGQPGTMKLKQDGKEVHGKYFTEDGVKAGKIEGSVSKNGRRWEGTYQNTNDRDVGEFFAKLKSDDVSFRGEFTSADGETYKWHGEMQ